MKIKISKFAKTIADALFAFALFGAVFYGVGLQNPVQEAHAACITPVARNLVASPNPVAPNQPITLSASGSYGSIWHFSLNGADIYSGTSGSYTYAPGITSTSTFGAYYESTGSCADTSNDISVTVTVQAAPVNGTVNVTNPRSWTLNGSGYSGNQSLSEPAGSYGYSPAAANYAETRSDSCSAAGGSGCTSNTSGNLVASGTLNFVSNYNQTTCTINVQGVFDSNAQAATNQSFNISGYGNASGTDTSGLESYTLPSDASGTNYTLSVSGTQSRTVNGYVSSFNGLNSSGNPSYTSASQTCFPGQTITFVINYISKPILSAD